MATIVSTAIAIVSRALVLAVCDAFGSSLRQEWQELSLFLVLSMLLQRPSRLSIAWTFEGEYHALSESMSKDTTPVFLHSRRDLSARLSIALASSVLDHLDDSIGRTETTVCKSISDAITKTSKSIDSAESLTERIESFGVLGTLSINV